MRDALPIVYRLVDANLEALGTDVCAVDSHDLRRLAPLIAPHIAWLFKVTQHLAQTGEFSCAVWPGRADRTQAARPPFHSDGTSFPLVPHGHSHHGAFALKFGQALQAVLAEIRLGDQDPVRRQPWFARALAAAALTAHLALLPHPPSGRVALDAALGEDDLTARVTLGALIAEFPAPLIKALPVYGDAERATFEMCMSEIRMAFATLGAEASPSRTSFELAGRLANLLAFCCSARGLDGGKGQNGGRKLHERARRLLVAQGICWDDAQARQQLLSIGIGDTFEDRDRSAGAGKLRFPTKNSEDQARCRGKTTYLEHWALACAQRGVLTVALINEMTQSPKVVRKLLEWIPESGGTRADSPSSSCPESDIPDDAVDTDSTVPGAVSLNQDRELP